MQEVLLNPSRISKHRASTTLALNHTRLAVDSCKFISTTAFPLAWAVSEKGSLKSTGEMVRRTPRKQKDALSLPRPWHSASLDSPAPPEPSAVAACLETAA